MGTGRQVAQIAEFTRVSRNMIEVELDKFRNFQTSGQGLLQVSNT